MKKTILHLFTISLLLLSSLSINAQTSYVDLNATGSEDGSSWANAYTSLNDALENANSGEIWVATGRYTPEDMNMDTTTTFKISSSVSLYGGFAGTETDLSQRDIAASPTTLSGDINGDDIDNDFTVNKGDNVQHVLFIDSLLSNPVIIDGFTINGGNTGENFNQDEVFFAGGGVFTFSTVEIRKCIFENNSGTRGASIAISPTTGGGNNSKITDCTFTHNRSILQSAGIYVNGLDGLEVEGCDFTENNTSRGTIQLSNTSNCSITDCNFIGNEHISPTGFGGALFSWQNRGLSITDCVFENNIAGNGGVAYIDGRNIGDTGEEEVSFKNCTFTSNTSLDYGGSCIYSWQVVGLNVENSSFNDNLGGNGGVMYLDGRENPFLDATRNRIRGCTFTENRSNDFGGGVLYNFRNGYFMDDCTFVDNRGTNGSHLFNTGDSTNVIISNSSFSGGLADFGGAHTCYGVDTDYFLSGNTYNENSASTSGGGIIIGFDSYVELKECDFIGNQAGYGGGIYMQNDNMTMDVINSNFTGNSASFTGGGINVSGGHSIAVSGTNFNLNTAETGGGLSISEFDAIGEATLDLSNSFFTNNTVSVQGGGINLVDADATIHNIVMANNNTLGVGGAISANAAEGNVMNYSITNSTLASNGGIIGGIAQWQDMTNATLIGELQNTLLFNNGPNYGIEEGTPTIISKGGNLVSDMSLQDVSLATDINAAGNPFFVDVDNFDFQLTEQSPAINAGVETNAPLLDILGNPRVDGVDSGAYEFQGVSSSEDIVLNKGQLQLNPNPVSTTMTLNLNNEWKGNLNVTIYTVDGRMLKQYDFNKVVKEHHEMIDVSFLDPQMYFLSVTDGTKRIISSFAKVK